MANRYSLRFENGERRGEVVPLTGPVFTVGRRPGNSLQVVEGSVSGKHAELRVGPDGIALRDLGSTNGTRVGSERVIECRLRPGATVTFGNVSLTLIDVEAGARATGTGAGAGLAGRDLVDGGDDALRVSAEDLARARKGSRIGLVALVVLAAGGAGAWWWSLGGGSGGRGEALRPVPAVPGNLLADGFSFEGDASSWTAEEDAPAAFVRSGRSRYSGEQGIGVTLEEGDWAVHASPAVEVREGLALTASAVLRAPERAAGRLGIELSATDGSSDPVAGWSDPLSEQGTFQPLELRVSVPGGYDRARVLVAADPDGGEGRVEVDDVALASAGGGAPAVTFEEYEVFAVGRSANLFKVDRTLLSGLAFAAPESSGRRDRAPLALAGAENGVRLSTSHDEPLVLRFLAEAAAVESGLATMGAGGYAQRSEDFEEEGVTDLLLGRGASMIRIALGGPAKVRARPEQGGYRVRAELVPGAQPLVQLRFREESQATVNLAADANAAEQRGDLGECLRLWQRLLDEYPFEESQVARAEAVRARLLRAGFEEVRGLAVEIERAEFFRLVDLYRECHRDAMDIARRYAGSEVESDARELIADIEAKLADLEADLDRHEVQRLRAIQSALEAQGAEGLSREVRDYLATRYGQEGE